MIPKSMNFILFHRVKVISNSDVAKVNSTELSISLSPSGNSPKRYNDTHFGRRRYRSVETRHNTLFFTTALVPCSLPH